MWADWRGTGLASEHSPLEMSDSAEKVRERRWIRHKQVRKEIGISSFPERELKLRGKDRGKKHSGMFIFNFLILVVVCNETLQGSRRI